MTSQMTRRSLLMSVPMLAAARRLLAQEARPTLTLRTLNHIAIAVSDKRRSMEFYQGLFGWPINHTQGGTQGLNAGYSVGATGIRVGSGPQYITMSQQARPGWGHFCMTVESFDVDRITQVLARHGVSRTRTSEAGPMRAWVRSRGPENGGANEGTPEFYVNDPDGLRFQLQDRRYCGGPGVLGDGCPSATPLDGVLVVRDFQSFTLSVPNQERSLDFLSGALRNDGEGTPWNGADAGRRIRTSAPSHRWQRGSRRDASHHASLSRDGRIRSGQGPASPFAVRREAQRRRHWRTGPDGLVYANAQ